MVKTLIVLYCFPIWWVLINALIQYRDMWYVYIYISIMFCIPISPVMGRMTTNDTPRFGQPSRLPSSREPSALPRAWWLLWIPMNPSLAWPTWGIRDSGGKDMDYMCVELWVYFIALYYILNYVLRKHVSIIYNALILYCVYYIFNSCYIYYLNYIYIR